MTSPQRLPNSLTPLDQAFDALLRGVEPVAPVELPLVEALRCIAADMPALPAHPPRDIAAVAVFLASDDSGWLTGEHVVTSGGLR